jgi:uncharacterized LabA/DUF88 family protein
MMRYPEKIALYIDASNLFHHSRAIGLRIDFDRFRQFFERRGTMLAYAWYYTGVEELSTGERPLQGLLDFLSYHGYTVVQKPMKEYNDKKKGNIDVEMTMDIMMQHGRLDRVILVSGDGDFKPLVDFVKAHGTRVTVVSSMQGNMLSNDLRKSATDLIDLADIRNEVCQLPT